MKLPAIVVPLYYGPPNYGLAIETYTYLTSELRTPLYSVKRTDFVVLLVPRLYKIHSILRTLAGLSHKIVRHRRLIH